MIYLVGGRAGEGKTTFSTMCCDLIESVGAPCGVFAFAQGVKDTARFMGWDGIKDEKGRTLLQAVGNAGRVYRKDLWVERTICKMQERCGKDLLDGGAFFVDDWRFPNEEVVAKLMLGATNVKTIRIIRPEEFHALWGKFNYDDISESSLPLDRKYDYTIDNKTNSLDALQKLAASFFQEIR